jgi:hypothetical protein
MTDVCSVDEGFGRPTVAEDIKESLPFCVHSAENAFC